MTRQAQGSIVAIVIGLGVCAGNQVAQNQPGNISVRSLMSAEEFQVTGLDKLSASELAALDAWFIRAMLQLLTSAPSLLATPDVRGRAFDFCNLEGAVIVADNGKFLGKITVNSLDWQSIGNEIGPYESPVSLTSIFNEVSSYGGPFSRLSPFNRFTSIPPRIFMGDQFVAYLTVNPLKTPRINPWALKLIGWLRANP